MNWTDDWLSVLLSDEKKLNLDGPRRLGTLLTRYSQGTTIFFWQGTRRVFTRCLGVFSYNGTIDIKYLKGRQ